MYDSIASRLAATPNWSDFHLGDLRAALSDLLIATLEGPVDQEMIDYWHRQCDAKVDFLLYSFALISGGRDEPERDVGELVEEWASLPMSVTSKANLRPLYLNSYFFKYISTVELPRLHAALANPHLTQEQCIDFYITQLVYNIVVEERPGVFFTYHQIGGQPVSRIDALQKIRDDLSVSLNQIEIERLPSVIESLGERFGSVSERDAKLLVPVFKSLFLLMTYYVGSGYRRVHDAVTTLLSIEMGEFRSTFFENLPSIIQRRGGLLRQISIEASRTEKTMAPERAEPREGNTDARGPLPVAAASGPPGPTRVLPHHDGDASTSPTRKGRLTWIALVLGLVPVAVIAFVWTTAQMGASFDGAAPLVSAILIVPSAVGAFSVGVAALVLKQRRWPAIVGLLLSLPWFVVVVQELGDVDDPTRASDMSFEATWVEDSAAQEAPECSENGCWIVDITTDDSCAQAQAELGFSEEEDSEPVDFWVVGLGPVAADEPTRLVLPIQVADPDWARLVRVTCRELIGSAG